MLAAFASLNSLEMFRALPTRPREIMYNVNLINRSPENPKKSNGMFGIIALPVGPEEKISI